MDERLKTLRRRIGALALRIYLAPLRRRYPGGMIVGIKYDGQHIIQRRGEMTLIHGCTFRNPGDVPALQIRAI